MARAILSCAGLTLAFAASAQIYPAKPIRLIVPYPGGGIVDLQARALTDRLAPLLGQPVIVDPRPGANSDIGTELVARAAADGHTLLLSSNSLIINPITGTNQRWKPQDLRPVTAISSSPAFLVVPPDSPVASLAEYVKMARGRPGLQFGHGGEGSSGHTALLIFVATTGITIEPVPYKGAPPMVPDLANGLVSLGALPGSVAAPAVKSGKVRALANLSDRRSQILPNVPTIGEAGFPDATTVGWFGVHAPAGTPEAVLRTLAEAIRAATAAPQFAEKLANLGGDPMYMPTTAFAEFLDRESRRLARVLRPVR